MRSALLVSLSDQRQLSFESNHSDSGVLSLFVLVLALIQLIFVTEAPMMPYFIFEMSMALIASQYFSFSNQCLYSIKARTADPN